MPKFKALYYPTFEPPAKWLRSFLLFFDEINTIVPEDATFDLSAEASKVIELMPDAFGTISPYLDAFTVKVRDQGRVSNKAIYLAIGVNIQGLKEVFGL